MSLTAMAAPKPMRQPASTEKNGPPKPCPIGGILGLPPPTNLANHTPQRLVRPDRHNLLPRIRTVPNQLAAAAKDLHSSRQASSSPHLREQNHVRKSTERHARARDPHPGTRVPTSGKGMAAPRDASKSTGSRPRQMICKEKGVE